MKDEAIKVSKEGLADFVKEFLVSCKVKNDGATVVALHGDLGAGKTTFVKTLAVALSVSEEVTSPTFTIMKQYETADEDWDYLLHMDAYRIDDIAELGPLGFSELLKQPKTLFCIEWAEKIQEVLPHDTVELFLSNTEEEDVRTIQISNLL